MFLILNLQFGIQTPKKGENLWSYWRLIKILSHIYMFIKFEYLSSFLFYTTIWGDLDF